MCRRHMDAVRVTLLGDGGAHELSGRRRGETLLVAPGDLAAATGWRLEPRGLCRGSACVPARERPGLVVNGLVDLAVFAALLDRPLACDAEQAVAALGDRAAAIASLAAPDFTLPDVEGRPFTFSALGRHKRLLVAWASW